MIEKIIQKLLFLVVLIFPLGLLLRIKLYANVYVVPQDIVVGVTAVITLYYYLKRKRFPKKNFFKFQLLFVFIGFVSLIINFSVHSDVKFIQSFLYSLRYLSYLLLIIAPITSLSARRMKTLLLLSGTLIIVIGFWQFFFYYDLFKLFYLGWDNHLYRMFSTFLDPNFAGVFFVVFLFYIVWRIVNNRFEYVYKEIIIAFCTFIAIYLTFSRTALVALLAGIISFAILKKKMKEVLLVIVLLTAFLFLISDTHVEGLNPLRTASSSKRIDSVKESLDIISKNPIVGVGFNAFRYAQLRYGYRNEKGASWSNADAGTDNSFLFAMSTTGVVGITIYLISFYYLGKDIISKQKKIRTFLIPIMIAICVASFFTNILFYTPILTFWFLSMRVMGVGSKVDR